MKRGTTPTLAFTFPYAGDTVKQLEVALAQRSGVVLTRTLEQAELDEQAQQLRIRLTQEETMLFSAGYAVEMQIRVLFQDGSAIASDIMTTTVERLLREGVLA